MWALENHQALVLLDYVYYAKPDGSLPFQDTIVLPQPDNSLLTSGV